MNFISAFKGLTFQPPGGHLFPYILLAALLVGFAIWAYRRNPAPLSPAVRTMLWVLRGAAFVLLLLLICRPMISLGSGPTGGRGVAILYDTSESQELPAGPNPGGVTRAAQARDAMAALLPGLKGKHAVKIYGFDREARPLPDDVRTLLNSAAIRPTGDLTGMGPAIETAVGEIGRARTGALVVISDGVSNTGLDPLAVARRLALPVYAVGVGSDSLAADAAIARIRVNRSSFLGDEVPLAVVVHNTGLAGKNTEVTVADITRPAEPSVVARQALSWAPNGAEQEIHLRFRPAVVGLHFYEVRLPEESGEFTAVNNRRMFALEVREEKSRVLLLAGTSDWDATFVKRVLDADSSLAVTGYFRLGGGWRRLDRPTVPAGSPFDAASLGKQALVVMMDMDGRDLPGASWEALAAWVRRGGGLLVFGGARDGGIRRLAGSAIAGLLPLDPASANGNGSTDLQVGLTASGRRHPVTLVDEDDARNAALWTDLPPLSSPTAAPALRGGADVLVRGTGDDDFPILVAGRGGAGKVLVAPAFGYWKWDFRLKGYQQKEDFHQRLWTNAVRWLTSPDLASRLFVEPGQTVFERGEEIDFSGRLADRDYQPVDGAEISVTITRADSTDHAAEAPPAPRTFALAGSGGGFYAGQTGSLPPGRYRFRAQARQAGSALGEVNGVFAVETMGIEFRRPAADRAFLARLAAETGGRLYSAEEARKLPDELKVQGQPSEEIVTLDVWDNPWFFVILVGVLSVEWFLRRRRGMV